MKSLIKSEPEEMLFALPEVELVPHAGEYWRFHKRKFKGMDGVVLVEEEAHISRLQNVPVWPVKTAAGGVCLAKREDLIQRVKEAEYVSGRNRR